MLIQFGTWNLHGFTEQRFELVQNGNGLSVNAVQMERGHANGRLIFKRADEHGRTQESFDFVCELVDCLGAELIEKRHEHWSRRAEQATLAARTIHEAGGTFGEHAVACIESKAGIDFGDIVDLNGNKACLARTRRISPIALTSAWTSPRPVTESVVSAKLRLMIMPTYMLGSVSVPSKR